MNIDYAKIIETANKRKEALQDLAAMLQHTPEMLGKAEELLAWCEMVSKAYASLDREGQALLPTEVKRQLESLPTNYMKTVLTNSPAIDERGLRSLNHLLQATK